MPAIGDTLRKLNPWHKGKYFHLPPRASSYLMKHNHVS
jgi:hypothetical protein